MSRGYLQEELSISSRIIFLNGASSSGKSTLGRALQGILETPLFYLSSDQFAEAGFLPAVQRGISEGIWSWQTIRPRFFDAFHRCIWAFAEAGNDLIVEHVLEKQAWHDQCVALLHSFDVFYVGVHCPVDILEKRERARKNRRIGEGKSHLLEGVHTWGTYDFEIDTSSQTPEESADLVATAFKKRTHPNAFEMDYQRIRAQNR